MHFQPHTAAQMCLCLCVYVSVSSCVYGWVCVLMIDKSSHVRTIVQCMCHVYSVSLMRVCVDVCRCVFQIFCVSVCLVCVCVCVVHGTEQFLYQPKWDQASLDTNTHTHNHTCPCPSYRSLNRSLFFVIFFPLLPPSLLPPYPPSPYVPVCPYPPSLPTPPPLPASCLLPHPLSFVTDGP